MAISLPPAKGRLGWLHCKSTVAHPGIFLCSVRNLASMFHSQLPPMPAPPPKAPDPKVAILGNLDPVCVHCTMVVALWGLTHLMSLPHQARPQEHSMVTRQDYHAWQWKCKWLSTCALSLLQLLSPPAFSL